MGPNRSLWTVARCRRLLPLLLAVYAVGCLPEGSVQQVFGENMLLTVAMTVQTITWVFFNGLFGLI